MTELNADKIVSGLKTTNFNQMKICASTVSTLNLTETIDILLNYELRYTIFFTITVNLKQCLCMYNVH